jgi:hypothetical protein
MVLAPWRQVASGEAPCEVSALAAGVGQWVDCSSSKRAGGQSKTGSCRGTLLDEVPGAVREPFADDPKLRMAEICQSGIGSQGVLVSLAISMSITNVSL